MTREAFIRAIAIVVVAGYAVVFMVAWSAQAQTPTSTLRWKVTQCVTNDCIADALNRLSPEQAHEAKLTTWSNFTYVWFRE